METAEVDAYYKLRHPEEKNASKNEGERDNSLEWYIGKMNGKLELIEDIRLMISAAISELEFEKAREKAKILAQKGQHETTEQA